MDEPIRHDDRDASSDDEPYAALAWEEASLLHWYSLHLPTTVPSPVLNMVAAHGDGVRAAILAICQGGEYQFTPLVTDITLLVSQPGVVKHGKVIHRNAISKTCHGIACYSPFLETMQEVMSTSAVLAELGERFEGACTVLLSKTITHTLSTQGHAAVKKFGKLLKDNTILTTISLLHNPSAGGIHD
ncbi:hypothetical protein PC9H_011338 [Pleurotus ostreatus]|uniref:Uncharacterized protein n=1 Tax=Pleurotus ostreatus TaxID=5322 RepID=A0A8H7DLD2_PLEOS|nr:uncharacterized protein PC9H_011338 [Pleurotus ostreatus]KAF7420820.1 hypothetical protein PC9H_011338 [Pleurotus ostreatus]